jgi:hypothetical protein
LRQPMRLSILLNDAHRSVVTTMETLLQEKSYQCG